MTMIDVLCLGTPEVVGDAVGPLVGTKLSYKDFGKDVKIIGSFTDPVTVDTYNDKMKDLRPGAIVIVVDATVGPPGLFSISNDSLKPGEAVSRDYPPVGDITIRCFTGRSVEEMLYCSAELVYRLADRVVTALAAPLLITNK